MVQFEEARKDFVLDVGCTYLNCANMSPILRSVQEAGRLGLERRSYPWKIKTSDWFQHTETLRILAGRLFKTETDNIAIIPSVSYGIAVAAKNLGITADGKKILLLEDQFPSNYYQWYELAKEFGYSLKIVKRKRHTSLTDCILQELKSDVSIVSVPNCHWMDGALVDLKVISEASKKVNAKLVVDLSQSFGCLPTDINEIDPDFAVTVGYKWQLGPYGLGFLYVAPRYHQNGIPLEQSWLNRKGSDDFSKLTSYTTEYRTGARRFDMGESAQFSLVPMGIAALTQILTWDVNSIYDYIGQLTGIIRQFIDDTKIADSQVPFAAHMVGVPCKEASISTLKSRLDNKNIIVSFRGNLIRVSPYVYNTKEDILNFLSCID